LVLTDLTADNAILGEYNYLVIDEAHNLEKAASNYLGLETNIWKIRAFCNRLYRKDVVETGLLIRLRHKYLGENESVIEYIQKAIIDVNRLRSNSGEFFGRLTEAIRASETEQTVPYMLKKRYATGSELTKAGAEVLPSLIDDFTILNNNLRRIAEMLLEEGEEFIEGGFEFEIMGLADEAISLRDEIIELIDADDPQWVYWWQLPQKEGPEIQLLSAPLNPGEVLKSRLYPCLDSVIFTSATLTIAGSFEYFRTALGLDLLEEVKVEFKNYGSPFNYEQQALFGTPVFLPGPKMTLEFTDSLSELIAQLATTFRRGTLVLFTSHSQLNQVYNQIRGPLLKAEIPLLAQGIEGSRSDILRRFLRKRAVLLGTDSFWEGIDAPGEALEILVVAKLPFDVPTEPLVEARTEKLEQEGRNPFLEYSIPEAAIKLRQGIGRLIRSSTDIGAVIICDTRVVNTKWGEIFRNSLPGQLEIFRNIGEMTQAMQEIFQN
jgi:Rad3-related DNA helicase